MKKKISIIITLALLLFIVMSSVSAGWFDILNGNDSKSYTNDDNTLVVGFDVEFPPYGYKDENGNFTGFDLEIAKEICNRNNWTFAPQPIDWDAIKEELESGSVDCIISGFTMDGRENEYTWSEPYLNNKQIFVINSNSEIKSLADLKGKIVETQKDSSALASLKGDNKSISDTFQSLIEVSNYNTGFMDLKAGACDALAMDIGVAKYNINNNANPNDYEILNESINNEKYSIGFKLGNTDLRDKIQLTLNEMFKDGTILKLAEKHGISEYELIQPSNSTDN